MNLIPLSTLKMHRIWSMKKKFHIFLFSHSNYFWNILNVGTSLFMLCNITICLVLSGSTFYSSSDSFVMIVTVKSCSQFNIFFIMSFKDRIKLKNPLKHKFHMKISWWVWVEIGYISCLNCNIMTSNDFKETPHFAWLKHLYGRKTCNCVCPK